MIKFCFFQPLVIATAAMLSFLFTSVSIAQIVIDFDELDPPGSGFFDGYGPDATTGAWTSGQAEFNTGMFGPGWSYSSVNDSTTAGFTNQWAAITGTDFSGDGVYAMGNSFSENGAVINLPNGNLAESVWVTNSTFAFLSMLNGDDFARQFGGESGNDPDFFKVTFNGFSDFDAQGESTGSVEFFLADFRFTDNTLDFIVDTWEWVDLKPLGSARSVAISFDSSDVGKFGINTPTYVAIDELSLAVRLGDVDQNGVVDLFDVSPFVALLTNGEFLAEADANEDGVLDLFDVAPFVELIAN